MPRTAASLLVPAALVLVSGLGAQTPDLSRLKRDVFTLADPAMEGRATGTPGQARAAAYIARRMKENRLRPLRGPGLGGASPYHFAYDLQRRRLDVSTRLRADGIELKLGQDFHTSLMQAREGEVVLVSATLAPDLKGKWAALAVGPDATRPELQARIRAAVEAGALGAVAFSAQPEAPNPLLEVMGRSLRDAASEGKLGLREEPSRRPLLILTPEGQKQLGWTGKAPLVRSESLGRLAFQPVLTQERVGASDLLAQIPGEDPALRHEYVVVSAHHDHVGMEGGRLHPGADDNASGTAGILELGRLLRRAHPKRSILILSVSGEELGLFGSEAFLAHPPVDPVRIKADINLDMIGRNAPGEINITPARVEGAITTLTAEARRLAAREGLSLGSEADEYWTRSDHYNFFKQGIPAVFFFAGMHGDYHQPGDTPDKIDVKKMARIVRLAYHLTLATANAPQGPTPISKEVWSTWTWPSPVEALR